MTFIHRCFYNKFTGISDTLLLPRCRKCVEAEAIPPGSAPLHAASRFPATLTLTTAGPLATAHALALTATSIALEESASADIRRGLPVWLHVPEADSPTAERPLANALPLAHADAVEAPTTLLQLPLAVL